MNRPIKFRSWNVVDKVMSPPFDMRDIFNGPKGKAVREFEDYIVSQFTGITDKNGKEIYEGDIVRTDEKYYPIKFVSYTADITNYHDGDWDEWYCGFDLGVPNDECRVLHYQLTDEVEVIGNIYQNPELLKHGK